MKGIYTVTKPLPKVVSKVEKISIRGSTEKTATSDAAVKRVAAPKEVKAPPKRSRISTVQPEERHHLIEVAAYYIALAEELHGTSSHDHWMKAEREIDAMIADGKFAA